MVMLRVVSDCYPEAALTVDQRSALHFAAESGAAVATAVLLGGASKEFGATAVTWNNVEQPLKIAEVLLQASAAFNTSA